MRRKENLELLQLFLDVAAVGEHLTFHVYERPLGRGEHINIHKNRSGKKKQIKL